MVVDDDDEDEACVAVDGATRFRRLNDPDCSAITAFTDWKRPRDFFLLSQILPASRPFAELDNMLVSLRRLPFHCPRCLNAPIL